MENSQALTLYEKIENPVAAVESLGTMFARSGMFGCEKAEQGQVLAFVCLAEKKPPTQLLREYHLINGRLSDRADSMAGKFRSAGGKIKVLKRTPEEASVELSFDGQKVTFSLTWEDVQQEPFCWTHDKKTGEPVLRDNWKTPRVRMQTMWARVISDGVRTMAPEIVAGTFTPEELEDRAPAPTQAAPLFPEQKASPAPGETPGGTRKATEETKSQPGKKGGEKRTAPPQPADAPKEVDSSKAKDAGNAAGPSSPVDAEALPAVNPETGKLTPESVQLLEEKIGDDNAEVVLAWLEARKWIPKGGTLLDLPLDKAERIIAKPDKVIATAKGGRE